MSSAVICDKCKKAMYADSRSNKDAYATLKIDYCSGYSEMHLCKLCYRQFRTEFVRDYKPEEFDDNYGEVM